MDHPSHHDAEAIDIQKPILTPFWSVFASSVLCCQRDLDILALLINDYSKVRIEFVLTPKHANVLYVAGFINAKRAPIIRHLYEQMAEPRYVVAAGSCAVSQGLYERSYVTSYMADEIIPVDAFVAGCPPTWQNIAKAFESLTPKG